jgi:hypothetical protein
MLDVGLPAVLAALDDDGAVGFMPPSRRGPR